MILPLQGLIRDAIIGAIQRQYGLADVPPFAVEVPPARILGDLAVAIAFQLARPLRKAPRVIAQEIAAGMEPLPGVARIVVAPSGYLNFYLERETFLLSRLRATVPSPPPSADKAIVEHTAINPNKAAHIGHLRNATLGDTLVRVLRFRGNLIEVQNYIDDLGVQVADIVVGFRELEKCSLDQVRETADTTRFDYYCWDLYAKVTDWYERDRNHLSARAATLDDLEHGDGDAAAVAALIVERIVRAHLNTMARLGIGYDLLTHEGDILRLRFWAHAFEILKASGAVFLQQEGRLTGCWVMRIDQDGAKTESASAAGESAGSVVEDDREEPEAREKVIVRSNGVVTYVGKDIANQLWKFGLLGSDFHYRLLGTQENGRPLWSTTTGPTEPGAPAFGHARRIYNVIDSRQMYLQALLSQALRTLGHPEAAENSIHFSYEMVALSHATARELGYPPDEDGTKPFVEVSGRKGLGVKIDDLLDLLIEKAAGEVATRNPEISGDDRRRAASQIAVGAIRYFMLKYSRGKLIVFDIEEALSFEGESGPYLQYAVVRANNIFHKLQEREALTEADIVASLESHPPDELTDEASALWALVFEASRLDDIVDQVVRSLEFSVLAKYAFGLAQLFNAFYHRYSILNEDRPGRKRWRAAGVAHVRAQLASALDLMGIEVPSRM